MDLVKKYDGQLVQIVGVVRKADLDDRGVEAGAGRGRVTIGAPGVDPTRMNVRTTPTAPTATMDITSVRLLTDRCPVN
jgi:hypothetical protein